MKQNKNDPEPCKMRNLGGSEMGTCECIHPGQCLTPPLNTPVKMMISHKIDQYLAKIEEKINDK